MEAHRHPMQLTYKACFWMLGALGLGALVTGAADLSGLSGDQNWLRTDSPAERWTAVVAGVLILPWAITGALHACLVIAEGELKYLKFGVLNTTGVIRLGEIRRFGHGIEKRGGGRRDHVLLLDLEDGARRSIKLNMYQRGGKVAQELQELLGEEPAETTATWKGVRFAEEDRSG